MNTIKKLFYGPAVFICVVILCILMGMLFGMLTRQVADPWLEKHGYEWKFNSFTGLDTLSDYVTDKFKFTDIGKAVETVKTTTKEATEEFNRAARINEYLKLFDSKNLIYFMATGKFFEDFVMATESRYKSQVKNDPGSIPYLGYYLKNQFKKTSLECSDALRRLSLVDQDSIILPENLGIAKFAIERCGEYLGVEKQVSIFTAVTHNNMDLIDSDAYVAAVDSLMSLHPDEEILDGYSIGRISMTFPEQAMTGTDLWLSPYWNATFDKSSFYVKFVLTKHKELDLFLDEFVAK